MNIWRRWQLKVPLAPSPIAVDFSTFPPPQLYEGLNMVNWQLTNGQNFNWQLTNRWKSNWQLINGGNFNRQMTFVPPHPDSCTPAALNITQVGMKSGWYGLSISYFFFVVSYNFRSLQGFSTCVIFFKMLSFSPLNSMQHFWISESTHEHSYLIGMAQ